MVSANTFFKKITICLVFVVSSPIYGEEVDCQKYKYGEAMLRIKGDGKYEEEFRDMRLIHFVRDGGFCMPTNETYIVFRRGGYPRILATVEGHSLSFRSEDVDGDGSKELLVFFVSGGNMYNLKIYNFDKNELHPIPGEAIVSNVRSISINDKLIKTEYSYVTEKGIQLRSFKYQVISNEVVKIP